MKLTPRRVIDGLAWRADALYERLMPVPIKVWFQNREMDARIRRDETSYARERLMHTYREGLRLLAERDPDAAAGDYLEFGVYHGTSLSCMHRVREELGLTSRMRLFGFDSFEGLPESAAWEDDRVWAPGMFKSSFDFTRANLRRWGVRDDEVVLVKGWFNESLTPELRARHAIRHASVVMVDCDLYSSTVDVLRFVEPLVGSHAVLVFDDWDSGDLASKQMGERLAFEEYLAAHPHFGAEEIPGLNYKDKAGPRVFMLRRAAAVVAALVAAAVQATAGALAVG